MDRERESADTALSGSPAVWAGGAAVAAVLALLLAFAMVVHAGVEQGSQRRLHNSAHDTATWRCMGLATLAKRQDCLSLRAPLAVPARLATAI